MWNSCELEICPWHDNRYKRRSSHQANSSKKKSHKKKSESILKAECTEHGEQKINSGSPANVIPSESETNEKGAKNDNEGTEDKSGSANDPRKGEMGADKTTNRRSSAKARPRPKTAPPSRHPTVGSICQ